MHRGRRLGYVKPGSVTDRLQHLQVGERLLLEVPNNDDGRAMRHVHGYWLRAKVLQGRSFAPRYMLLVPPAAGGTTQKVMVVERTA